jgi:hypothetical protein
MTTLTRVRAALRCFLPALFLLLAACGGGGGDSMSSTPVSPPATPSGGDTGCGKVFVGLTDTDGDFLSYTVDVVSLTLKRANGDLIETTPAATRVDFAQYVDLSEFLTAATIPNGTYVEGTLRLDYSNADITVESSGLPVAAKVVKPDGSAAGVVDVNVTLDNRHRLTVAPGLVSLLTLDFNLAATNTVDLTTTPATVTVTPALVASLEPVDEKDLRLRGPLVSVDKTAKSYVVDVRPFHNKTVRLGEVTVHTTDTTDFEVNGVSSTGSAGLDALATAGAGTATVAFGTLDTNAKTFTASIVHAGTSVPGAGVDTVIGNVLSRNGNELTVRGATIVRDTDGARFVRGVVKVNVGANTKVFKDGVRPVQMLDINAVSVGQAIHAFGTASQSGTDWLLDATSGRVRMHVTHLFGFVDSSTTGALTLKLDSIDGRRVSAFNFAGTGTNTAMDADPLHYEVSTGALDLNRFAMGSPTKVFGFVTPFGMAPPDFDARTLIDFPALPARLAISWGTAGTTAPFSAQNTDGLVLDLTNTAIGLRHFIAIGPRVIDLKQLPSSPRIVPPTNGRSAYVIVSRDMSLSFRDFADFAAELTQRLNGTTAVLSLTANGKYDGDANTLSATSVVVVLK